MIITLSVVFSLLSVLCVAYTIHGVHIIRKYRRFIRDMNDPELRAWYQARKARTSFRRKVFP